MANTQLHYPEVKTWFIIWDDTKENILSYGLVEPTQCMETKWAEVDYYKNEVEWIDILANNGIDFLGAISEDDILNEFKINNAIISP
tara:strand:- start:919 stop:1179 length:261 start_codon:yes stop_codon:yes gene_type:complete